MTEKKQWRAPGEGLNLPWPAHRDRLMPARELPTAGEGIVVDVQTLEPRGWRLTTKHRGVRLTVWAPSKGAAYAQLRRLIERREGQPSSAAS